MTYGTIKVDTVTFTNDGVDKSVTLSGLVQNPTFSGNVTVTGTLSGVTVTGTTANFTSGNFTNISGGTHTITSGVFAAGSAASPSITFTGDLNTGIYSPGADQVAISTGGSGRLFVDASGRVGVGSAPSVGNGIHATINTNNYGTALVLQNANVNGWAAEMQFLGITTTDTQAKIGALATGPGSNSGALAFYTANAGSYLERLRITSAGLVGIGTSSPASLLSVVRAAEGTSLEALRLVNESPNQRNTSSVYIGMYGSNEAYERARILCGNPTDFDGNNGFLSFWTRNAGTLAEKVRIDNAGRVGIGTTTPQHLLDCTSIGRFTGNTNSAASGAGIEIGYDSGNTTGFIQSYNRGSSTYLSTAVDGSDVRFKTSSTERARIDSSGRLLVGTSDGSGGVSKLVVQGASNGSAVGVAQISYNGLASAGFGAGTDIGYLRFTDQGSNSGVFAQITATADATSGANDYPGRLVFSTTADGASSPTERMRIGQNGYIQCSETGTYSPDGGSVWHKFYQSVNERCLQTYNTAGTFTNYALTQYIAAGGGTGSGFASGFSDSGSIQRYIIFSNGNIQNINNSYGAISDLKLKENIVDASEQWNDIKNLRVRKYNLKQGGAHTQIGVIAQEIELVSPGLVYETTDRDTDGNDLGTVTKSVNYSVLYMKAVKALQEAMERIETLEAKVAALESA
jgi:hypothetical protein